MYKINHTTTNELSRVQEKITKELASEKIIQDIYEYIFQSKGKKTRAPRKYSNKLIIGKKKK